MSLRSENLLRPVRADQCRCRRCAAPILISTAKRHRRKCAPCAEVPRWVHSLGINRRTTLFMVGLAVVLGSAFHSWNIYDWTSRWRETFMQHPIIYGLCSLLAIASVLLVGLVIKSGRLARKPRTITSKPKGTSIS